MDRPDPFLCAVFMTAAFVLAGLVHSAWLRSRLSARLRIAASKISHRDRCVLARLSAIDASRRISSGPA